jgi:hypothetical protein
MLAISPASDRRGDRRPPTRVVLVGSDTGDIVSSKTKSIQSLGYAPHYPRVPLADIVIPFYTYDVSRSPPLIGPRKKLRKP